MSGVTHVIGAGLAGLSAATSLVGKGRKVVLHEATAHAGGRCRSYHDRALGLAIDNGNHIILSGNRDAITYLETIGASERVAGPASAAFSFFDLSTGERWQVDLGSGRFSWWIFDARKRPPSTQIVDYLSLLPFSLRPGDGTVGEAMNCPEPLYGRLIHPMLLATLNNEPRESSARLAAAVIRETVARGGRNCRPLIAPDGLSAAFVDPATAFLERNGASLRFGHKLRGIRWSGDAAESLEFDSDTVDVESGEAVVLAVTADAAARLLPDLPTPKAFRSIANIHFRVDMAGDLPLMTGIVNGTSQWVFRFPGRISVTISNADALSGLGREALASMVWPEVARLAGLAGPMPPWQVVNERRATFATVPEQEKRRPPARTWLKNLFLAGDWTATGLPPTIEGAVRSGRRAAELSIAGA
jgi:squalene-associated FAD-dependent desaturase